MKSKLYFPLFLLIIASSSLIAQNRFAVGIVSTKFGNKGSDSKFTEIKNPFGYGVVASYSLSAEVSIALTGEYSKGDLQSLNGNERDLRGHLSAFLTPLSGKELRPYISAGIVYTDKKVEYTNQASSKSDGTFNARFSIGADYHLIQNLFVNLDLGLYNDGMNIVGWSSSVGLRYGINLF